MYYSKIVKRQNEEYFRKKIIKFIEMAKTDQVAQIKADMLLNRLHLSRESFREPVVNEKQKELQENQQSKTLSTPQKPSQSQSHSLSKVPSTEKFKICLDATQIRSHNIEQVKIAIRELQKLNEQE